MKEIVALIRVNKIQKTRDALAKKGFYSMTVNQVLGRGKQKGIHYEIKSKDVPDYDKVARLNYIPKRMMTMMVPDSNVDEIVKTITETNQTGHYGDGKIFVCPLEDSIRVRTKETGEMTLYQ